MLAYAFLAEGAVEPLSGFAWPTPRQGSEGAWIDAQSAPREAVRGYPSAELPYWFDDELWSVELAGTVAGSGHVLLAERARLLDRITEWSDQLAWEFVASCAQRVAREAAAAFREYGQADAAAQLEAAPTLTELESAASSAAVQPGRAGTLAGYLTDVCFYSRDAGNGARAAGVAAKMSAYAFAADAEEAAGADERVAAERAWQSAWLVDRLGL
jgi:hypothetical protein